MARRVETLFVRYRRRGDAAALGRVFDRTAPEILRVAMHLARHPAEAEDLLQETFLTAIDRADGYDAAHPLVPWLVGILRNHARHRRRAHARRARREEAARDALAGGGERADDEAWMDVAWSDAVHTAVEALPDAYRQVLVLKLKHQKSAAEIALLLDLPPATVRSQIHRGLARLRLQLPPDRRRQALAVLPLGVGLGGVRERVLAHASKAAVATAAAGATLPVLGGLIMTKKSVIGAGLLAAVAILGSAAWLGGLFDPAEAPGGDDALQATLHGDGSPQGTTPRAPQLVGAGRESDPIAHAPAPDAPPATPTPAAWPPQQDVPADKGSVAGTLTFSDGTPVVGVTVALWGSPSIPATTDAEGRYHIHADWVHGRSLFVRLGRDDQPDYLGLLLSGDVAMKNGQLVMHDVTIERGIEIASEVVDARSGEPLEGVKVTLRRKADGRHQAKAGFLWTDAEGRFRFPYVPRDTYSLELEHAGYQATVRTYDLTQVDLPDRLTLTASRPLVIRFENLPEGAVGSQVTCDLFLARKITPENASEPQTHFSVSSKVKIAEGGTLTVDAPQPGTYRCILFKSSHLPRLEREIEIPDGPIEPIVWTLAGGARVTGTLQDPAGQAISGARVTVNGAAGRPTTDDEGRFALPYVPSGKQTVSARIGTATIHFGVVDVPGSGSIEVELDAPGSSALEGRLLVGGNPADIYSSQIKVRRAGTSEEVARARPNKTGGFRMPYLPAGRYEIDAWSSAGVPQLLKVELVRGQRHDVGAIDLEAYIGIPVRILVPSGVVPDGIGVAARNPAYPLPARTPSLVVVGSTRYGVHARFVRSDDGNSRVVGLTRGRHRLEFNAPGYVEATVEVDVKPGMTVPIEVRLDPGDR